MANTAETCNPIVRLITSPTAIILREDKKYPIAPVIITSALAISLTSIKRRDTQ